MNDKLEALRAALISAQVEIDAARDYTDSEGILTVLERIFADIRALLLIINSQTN